MKRILLCFLSLCIVFSALHFDVWAEPAEPHTHCACSGVLSGKNCESHDPELIWQEWTSTDSLPTASGNYYLAADVQLKGTEPDARVSGAVDVKLCLNGHNISLAKSDATVSYRISVWDAASKLTIMDCKAQLDSNGLLTKGGTISGSSYGSNGAIYARGGELTLIGVQISDNTNAEKTATYGGGAIQIRNGAKVVTEYVKFSNNTAGSDGGAICIKSGSLHAKHTVFTNNTAGISGGAIYLENNSCSVRMENCEVTNHTAAGAAIYVSGATAVLKSVTVTGNVNNSAAGGGSAVHTAASGNTTLHSCTITDNQNSKATDYAGAVYLPNGNSSLTVSGRTVIDHNTVGGGDKEVNVFLQNSGTKMTVGALTEGAKISVTTRDPANAADPNVFLRYLETEDNATPSMPQESAPWIVYANKVANGESACAVGYNATERFFFTENTNHKHAACSCAMADDVSCEHGTIAWQAWEYTDRLPTNAGNYYLTADVQLKGKEPDARISGAADVKLCLNGYNISLAKSDSEVSYRISVWDTTSKLTIMDCQAQVNENGQLEKGGVISGSSYGANGGIYARGGELTLIGVEVSGNTNAEKTTTYGGGAIQIRNGAKVTAEYVRFSGNTAASDGGAICIKNGSLQAENVTFTDNTAGISGGAIYLENSSCTANLKNCLLDSNLASGQGGAIYEGIGSKLSAENITVSNNNAAGAAVYLNGAEAVLVQAVMTGNVCSVDGASALHIANGSTAQLKDCTITGNQSPNRTEYCGAVYVPNNRSNLTISGHMVVDDNTVGGTTKESNIFLQNEGIKLIVGQLAQDSRVGITTLKTYTAQEDPDLFLACAESVMPAWDTSWLFYENTLMNVGYSEEEVFFFTAVTDHTHCLCDNTGAVGCDHGKIQWLPWSATDRLPTNSGNYYLTEDVTLTSAASLKNEADVKLCLNGKTVTVNAEVPSSIYQLFDSAILTISDCTAVSGKASYVAGKLTGAERSAIWLEAGDAKLNLYDGMITENHSAISGGAIRLNGTNVFNMYGGEISGNSGVSAGALYVNNNSAVNMYGGKINNNTARNNDTKKEGFAGAVLLVRGGELNLHDGSIVNNTAREGGAVYATGEAKVLVLGGRIAENTAKANGGAIGAVESSSVTIAGGAVEKNKAADGNGGAVYAEKATVKLSGGKIARNTATAGGGLYIYLNTILDMSGGEVSGNEARATGGGIQHLLSSANYTGGTVKNNLAKTNGGGICTSQKCKIVMDGTTVSGNTAVENGGGVLLQGYDSVLNFTSGAVYGNQAKMGGGLFISTNTTLNMSGGEVSGNEATQTGGGIQMYVATANYTGGSIKNNFAGKNGGGLCTSQKCLVNLKGTTIGGNKAAEAAGGVLLQGYGSVMNFSSGVVQGNTAQMGGGMYISTNTTLNMTGGTVRQNTAENTGGGIQQLLSTAKYTGGTIENNTANVNGGGICTSQKCTVVLDGIKITGNSAAEAGGGMVLQGYGSTLHLASGEICNNTATLGAGLFGSVNTVLNITGGSVFENAAKEDGGGVYLYYSTVTVSGGEVHDNTAGVNGGGVFSDHSNVEMCDFTIRNNTANASGGGIYTGQMDIFSLKNVSITENTAQESGGGLYLGIGSTTKLEDVTITHNQANAYGGALYAIDDLTMAGLTATNNKSGKGGAVYLDVSNFDGRSYFTGLMKMSGNMRICDNNDSPADLFIGEGTTISVSADGLGKDTKINVTLASGVLTNTVFGAYDYEGGNCKYVITWGDRSLRELEQLEVPEQNTEPETTPEPEQPQTEEEPGKMNLWLVIGAGAGAAVIAVMIVVIALLKKRAQGDRKNR